MFAHSLTNMTHEAPERATPERLMQFGSAYAPPFIIGAAVSNKVFDPLAKGSKTVEEELAKKQAPPRVVCARS
jgi:hypothetical protein